MSQPALLKTLVSMTGKREEEEAHHSTVKYQHSISEYSLMGQNRAPVTTDPTISISGVFFPGSSWWGESVLG